MAKIQSVTIADIARRVGVCDATVSLALRNHPSISLKTRRRIGAAASKLNYRPHPAVTALMGSIRAKRPLKIRSIIAGITTWAEKIADRDPTRQRFFNGAAERAIELGYVLKEFPACIHGMSTPRLNEILQARGISGLLILPVEKPVDLSFSWKCFSSATIGYTFDQAALHRSIPAYFENVVIALQELQRRGYRRVGLVNTPALRNRLLRTWLGAFCAWQSESGPAPSKAILQVESGGDARFQAWMKTYRPDAIIYGGAPVYDWIKTMGLTVPRDLGLVALCVAGMPSSVSLAQVVEKPEVVGAAAIDLIVEQMQRNELGIPKHPKEVFITGEWIDGISVTAPATFPRMPGSMPAECQKAARERRKK